MAEKLLVTVVKAVNLLSKDSNGLSDPYVVLKVGAARCRTRTVPETLDPVFDETFVLSVNQFEPVRVEVWDYDQLSQDDFEGGFTLNWWTIDALVQTGAVDGLAFALKSGHGMRKNVDVQGEVVLNLRLANFAKDLQERGRLTELFPDTPAREVCLAAHDCAVARAAADSPMAGELAPGAQPRRRSGSSSSGSSGGGSGGSRSVSEKETMPGTVFLLTHFFYAYAVTTKEPLKLELAYDDIRSVARSSYSRSGVVLTTTRGWKFLIDSLASPDDFIREYTDIAAQSLCSPLDALASSSSAAGEGDPATGGGGASGTPADGDDESSSSESSSSSSVPSPVKGGGGAASGATTVTTTATAATPRPCEPLLPVTVPLKVYVEEHATTYKAAKGAEQCPVSLFVGSKPSLTFKRVVEEAFVQANLPHGSSHKSRIFTVLPAVRRSKQSVQKLTSKWTIASCMAPYNIVWPGAAVVLRHYNKSKKSGISLPNPAALVAAAAAATAATFSGANAAPGEVTLAVYRAPRGPAPQPLPYPLPAAALHRVTLPNDVPLAECAPAALAAAGLEYSPARHELCITTLGAEPGVDAPLLVPLDLARKPMELFLVDTDVLVLKDAPPFRTVADKFPACDSLDKTAMMLACMYAAEPLVPFSTDGSSSIGASTIASTSASGTATTTTTGTTGTGTGTTTEESNSTQPVDFEALAKALNVSEEEVAEFRARGAENATYGAASLLVELQDRLRHVGAHAVYGADAFESAQAYADWRAEEQEHVLALMRDVVFRRQRPAFCAEVHVRVRAADDVPAGDLDGFSDPYCTVVFKTQVQSTKVCLHTLHPKWDEEFVFSVATLDKAMTFNLYDWDALSAPDYLGTATLSFAEHVAVLDGARHTLTLPFSTKGTLTLEVQAFFDGSRYLDPTQAICPAQEQTFSSEKTPEKTPEQTSEQTSEQTPAQEKTPAQEQTPAPAVDYRACYRRLYSVLGEAESIAPEPAWLLRELAERGGVSQVYCASLKLDDVLRLEPRVDGAFSRCLAPAAMRVLRPAAVPSREERGLIAAHVAALDAYLRERYLPLCFASKDATRPVMETCVQLFVECGVAARRRPDDTAAVLGACVRAGVRAQCALLTGDIAWDDDERVAGDVCALVRDALPGFFDALAGLYDAIMPTAVRARAAAELVGAFSACVDDCLARLCDALCRQARPHQGAAYQTLQAATALARSVQARTGRALDVPAARGLLLLWVKNNGPTLADWVERAISVDKRVPLQPGLLHSSSVVDVSEACAQIIAQMKELAIPDVFLWPQAGELLLGAMRHYFALQEARALATVRKHRAALFADERPLQKACIAVANIEKGQELVDTVISSVEEGMDAWRAAHTDPDSAARADISSQTLAANVAAALKAAQAAIAQPLRLLAEVLCEPVSATVDALFALSSAPNSSSTTSSSSDGTSAGGNGAGAATGTGATGATSATGATEDANAAAADEAVGKLTSRLDDAMVQMHERLSVRSFRLLLAACWARACDTLGARLAPDADANGPHRGMSVPAVRAGVERALTALYAYFGPDDGLARAALDRCPAYLRARRLVCLYHQSTENLIALTRSLSSSGGAGSKGSTTGSTTAATSALDPRLEGTREADVAAVLRTRMAEGDLWARAFARECGGSALSQAVRDHFSLPPSELLLDKWVCAAGRRTGTLYLLSRHLCFDSAFTKSLSDTSGIVLMLEDIRALDECPVMLLFKGIHITADGTDGELPVFSKFVAKVQDVITAIRTQALLVNNKYLAEASNSAHPSEGTPAADSAAADAESPKEENKGEGHDDSTAAAHTAAEGKK